jgi:cytochrome c biogenesis protein
MNLKKVLTGRKSVLAVFLLVALSIVSVNIIPQVGTRNSGGHPWYEGIPLVHALIQALGLNHIFATWWFLALAVYFVLLLLLSTWDQGQKALNRCRAPVTGPCGDWHEIRIPLESFETALRSHGYRPGRRDGVSLQYRKCTLGNWGNCLLHLGMTVSILFAFVYLLSEQRSMVRLLQGEMRPRHDVTLSETTGLLAAPLEYPAALRMERVIPEYWENDVLKTMTANLFFADSSGNEEQLSVEANYKKPFRNKLVYLSPTFGNAFHLVFLRKDGRIVNQTLFMATPARRDIPDYATVPLSGEGITIKAKYFADEQHSSLISKNPLLTLRLFDGNTFLGERQFHTGDSGVIGPYVIALRSTKKWVDLMFEGSFGTMGVFTGFFIILTGALSLYFLTPRSIDLRRRGETWEMIWSAARFKDMYREEKEMIVLLTNGKELS